MRSDALEGLVTAMLRYLDSAGFSARELARYTGLSVDQLAEPATRLSPSQLQRLWQLIQVRMLPAISLSVQVRPLIARQLAKGGVRVEKIAAELNMSRHTLYRRLKAENVTFAGLLEEVRREQALTYLRDCNRSLAEVAELLGFSELSAFSRAFKRWMGKSPAEFRSSVRPAVAL
ncbi:helix-turn-helix domain-containing protein [Marinobacter sp. X15-166B]|uniref:helix-turn-helix domain-containing protein n=1 Tax=Marinobacter sp. X15-166B TaxID=1897620 RepID=UPI000AECCB73|nr:helix-turn-helix transcriptional regulator [Marinobacter sp. X15-166B]